MFRRLTPILLVAGLLATAIAGAATAVAAASDFTPMPPVALPTEGLSSTGSTTATATTPSSTGSTSPTSAAAPLPRTGVNVGLELLTAAAMLAVGALLRWRPVRREPRP